MADSLWDTLKKANTALVPTSLTSKPAAPVDMPWVPSESSFFDTPGRAAEKVEIATQSKQTAQLPAKTAAAKGLSPQDAEVLGQSLYTIGSAVKDVSRKSKAPSVAMAYGPSVPSGGPSKIVIGALVVGVGIIGLFAYLALRKKGR